MENMDSAPDKEWDVQTEAEIRVTFPQDKDDHRLSVNTKKQYRDQDVEQMFTRASEDLNLPTPGCQMYSQHPGNDNFCCFMFPSLWPFVKVVPGN